MDKQVLTMTFSNVTKSKRLDLYKIDDNDAEIVGSIYLPASKKPVTQLKVIIKDVK